MKVNKDALFRAEFESKEREALLSSFHHQALLVTGFIRVGGESILGIIPEKRQRLFEEVRDGFVSHSSPFSKFNRPALMPLTLWS